MKHTLTFAQSQWIAAGLILLAVLALRVFFMILERTAGNWKADHWPDVHIGRPWHVRLYDWIVYQGEK